MSEERTSESEREKPDKNERKERKKKEKKRTGIDVTTPEHKRKNVSSREATPPKTPNVGRHGGLPQRVLHTMI